MKYIKSRKRFENSTGSLTYDPLTKEAYSYKWWCFLKKYGDVIVFNDYSYSISTRKHQNRVAAHLRETYTRSVCYVEIREGLPTNMESLVELIQKNANERIAKIEAEINKPRSQKKANKVRLEHIETIRQNTKDVLAKFEGVNFDNTLNKVLEERV